jgi:hypothetical protein
MVSAVKSSAFLANTRSQRPAPLALDRAKAEQRWPQALPALPCIVLLLAFPCAAQTETTHTYPQIVCKRFALEDASIPARIRQALNSQPKTQARDAQQRLWRASSSGLVEIEPSGKKKIWTGKDGLPILSLTGVALGPDGRLWLATRQGAICFQPDAPAGQQWFYFWGKRYLSDNHVAQIVAEKDRAWIRTQTGVSRIEFEPFDLEHKSALFVERLQSRHNRYGYTADCELGRPGDTSSFRLVPSDNDGLWTAIYVTAECFRFALTHSPEALRNARLSLAALLRLESISGIPGFPARALIHRSDYRAQEGEWHWTSDGEWEWKGDTSSDELVGHFLAYAVAYDLLPDESDRAPIRVAASRIAGHLLDHGLTLVGFGGRVTRWGNYTSAYFQTEEGKEDQALNSLELLSHLRVAYHITGEERFLTAYRELIHQRGYLENVTRAAPETPHEVNYSDEELAFLSFYPLLRYEDDAGLRAQFQGALTRFWRSCEAERNPLWNFIYAAGTGATDYDAPTALATLERIPLDTVYWTVKNSQRVDLPTAPSMDRFREKQSLRALSPNERGVMKWNGNPFQLDYLSEGRSEDDGAFFLLPYWLGRFHKLVTP